MDEQAFLRQIITDLVHFKFGPKFNNKSADRNNKRVEYEKSANVIKMENIEKTPHKQKTKRQSPSLSTNNKKSLTRSQQFSFVEPATTNSAQGMKAENLSQLSQGSSQLSGITYVVEPGLVAQLSWFEQLWIKQKEKCAKTNLNKIVAELCKKEPHITPINNFESMDFKIKSEGTPAIKEESTEQTQPSPVKK